MGSSLKSGAHAVSSAQCQYLEVSEWTERSERSESEGEYMEVKVREW